MKDIHLTTIQTNLHWENTDANLAMLEEKIAHIDSSTDILVLPEMFSTGFSMNARNLAEPMNFHTFKWMKNMATKTGALILGSYIVKEEGQYFNRLIWMQPDGNYQQYDKRHLFRMAGEHEIYSSGKKRLIAEWKGWKICPLVCYDLRFPAWSRNKIDPATGKLQYDLLLYVANWPAARTLHWQTLLQARAIENLTYVVGVNRIGSDGKQVEYKGHTAIINPKGEMVYEAGHDEVVQTTELNSESLNQWRSAFPAFMDADDFELR